MEIDNGRGGHSRPQNWYWQVLETSKCLNIFLRTSLSSSFPTKIASTLYHTQLPMLLLPGDALTSVFTTDTK